MLKVPGHSSQIAKGLGAQLTHMWWMWTCSVINKDAACNLLGYRVLTEWDNLTEAVRRNKQKGKEQKC